jgi:archaellum component FlaC
MKVSKLIQQLKDSLGKLRWRFSGLTRTVSSAKSDVERLDFLIELLKEYQRNTRDRGDTA